MRELEFKFAIANSKTIPSTWGKENIAEEEWMRGFMKKHRVELSLRLRQPEAASLSRATSFNRTNVNYFFVNLNAVYERYGIILPCYGQRLKCGKLHKFPVFYVTTQAFRELTYMPSNCRYLYVNLANVEKDYISRLLT